MQSFRRRAVATTTLVALLLLPAAVQSQYSYVTNDGTITITGYTGTDGALTLPDTIDGLAVTSVGNSVFYASGITNVTIPGSITNIGDYAFNCYDLIAAYFEGNAPTLGVHVFGSFPPNVTFPTCYYLPGATGWGQTFGGCQAFMLSPPYLCIPNNGAITIATYLGSGRVVMIPATIAGLPVATIGQSAFTDSSSITEVAFPNSITNIGPSAFQGCPNLTNLKFPASGQISIQDWAFANCTSLTSVTIPNSVTSLGYDAFGECTALTNVFISSSVNSIGQLAFYNCTALTGVYFRGNAPSGDWTIFVGNNVGTVYHLPGYAGWGPTFGGLATALWFLPTPLILSDVPVFGVHTNRFGFTISWATNVPVVVEACTDLSKAAWSPVATNTLNNGALYFSDPQWTNYPTRFYRIRSP